MGSSGGSSTSKKVTTRYAGYIETQHKEFLQVAASRCAVAIGTNPYTTYIDTDPEEAFFGFGYTISSYASLYDMFGKNMAGMDIEQIWTKLFNRLDTTEVNANILAEIQLNKQVYEDEVVELSLNARELNTIGSSSFVIGKAQIEKERIFELATYGANVRFSLLDMLSKSMKDYVNWLNKLVVNYAIYMKAYYGARSSSDSANYTFAWKDALWELDVEDNMRSYLGALPNATQAILKQLRKRSFISKGFMVGQSVVTGAQIGSATGAPYGALIGAYVGWNIGLAQVMAEDGNSYWWTPFVIGPEASQYIAFGFRW